jgi:hypothetical protein
MSLLGKLFGGNQIKEEEKKEYVNKLIPYKKWISNYDDISNQLLEYNIDIIKQNVDNIITRIDFENYLENKYGEEIGKKLYSEGVFFNMNEEQFDDCMKYKVIIGEEKIFDHLPNGIKKPYSIRKENITENKIRIIRSNSTKIKNTNRVDYIFENDQLIQIKNHKQ